MLARLQAGLQQSWHFEPRTLPALRRFLLAAVLVVLILLWLQPFGGDRYRVPFWSLRLAGYGLCLLLAALPMQVWARRRQARRGGWRLQDELLALSIWAACAAGLAYLHNTRVVSPRPPAFDDLLWFAFFYALPVLLLLLPVLLWRGRAEQLVRLPMGDTPGMAPAPAVAAAQLTPDAGSAVQGGSVAAPAAQGPSSGADAWLEVRGRNRDEQLRFRRRQFVCAQAQQNYVRVLLATPDGLQSHLLRLPISELAATLDDCWRVHRSWLVAPERVRAQSGARRQRQLHLDAVAAPVPVSADFVLPVELPVQEPD